MGSKFAQSLEKLGFTKTEAEVYIVLLKYGAMNGYQVGKILNMSRSSVYSALNNLYKKNFIYLIPGDTNEYRAEKPKFLIEKLKKNFIDTADIMIRDLEQISIKEKDEKFFNLEGIENLVAKTKEIINSAKIEICINCTVPIQKFENEIEKALKRGVRVILFSNPDEGIGINGIEQYGYFKDRWSDDERIMVVADYKEVMIGGGKKGSKITGTFSENPVLVQIFSEHINHDIYFSKLQKKYNKSVVIEEEERTGTIAEKKFFEELKKRVK